MPASTRVVAMSLLLVALPAAGARAAVVHRAPVPLDAFAADGANVVVGYRPTAARCAAVQNPPTCQSWM